MDSNRGEVGVDSIRIHGKKIENLPLGQGEIAAGQIPEAIANEKLNQIDTIRAIYPKATVAYLEGAIREAQSNIQRFKETKAGYQVDIANLHIAIENSEGMPTLRSIQPEIEVVAARVDIGLPEKILLIKDLKAKCSPYDRQEMWQQVKQYNNSIKRFETAIDTETGTIMELRENLSLAKQRDRELLALGVDVNG